MRVKKGDKLMAPSSNSARFIECVPFAFLLVLFGIVCGTWGKPAAAQSQWKAGISRKVITPEKAVWLAGYGSKRVPDGKIHDLWMKALALQVEEGKPLGGRAAKPLNDRALAGQVPITKPIVLITSDFQGVPRSMSDRVFAQLKSKFGLERKNVMFTFSHNHCGPRLGDDLIDYYPVEAAQEKLVAEYTDQMVKLAVELVGEALRDLAPATVHVGKGRSTFAVNRRNNREAEIPQLLAAKTPLKGPVDHDVPVLRVDRDGKTSAIVFGYACHPTTLSFLTWCGDYPGFAQQVLEKKHPGAMAMFVNTCGGDQNPLPRRSVELCEKYGNLLAAGVEDALSKPMRPVSAKVTASFRLIDLDYQEVVRRQKLRELLDDSHRIRARWAARMLQRLDRGAKFPASYPYPLHAWKLGDNEVLMIGMGAETVVDYALKFKKEFGENHGNVWVCGYADDMIAYIPSRRVWEEGGYEGGSFLFEYGRPAFRWAGDIEDKITRHVRELVAAVGWEAGEHRK